MGHRISLRAPAAGFRRTVGSSPAPTAKCTHRAIKMTRGMKHRGYTHFNAVRRATFGSEKIQARVRKIRAIRCCHRAVPAGPPRRSPARHNGVHPRAAIGARLQTRSAPLFERALGLSAQWWRASLMPGIDRAQEGIGLDPAQLAQDDPVGPSAAPPAANLLPKPAPSPCCPAHRNQPAALVWCSTSSGVSSISTSRSWFGMLRSKALRNVVFPLGSPARYQNVGPRAHQLAQPCHQPSGFRPPARGRRRTAQPPCASRVPEKAPAAR